MPLSHHLKKEESQGLVDDSGSDVTMAFVLDKGKGQTLGHIEHMEYKAEHLQKVLRDKVNELKLQGSDAVVLLPTSDYQIFLLEQPKVPDSEKAEAIKWLVAEYIDFSIEDVVVDFIELPQKISSDPTSMIYVIVARKSKVEELVNCVNASGLKLKAVDICQSALRQIAMHLDDEEEGQALLHLDQDRSHLILFKDKTMYMMEELELGLNDLGALQDSDKKDNNQLYQDLSLEIQRSLDYCASNLKNANISRLVLTPMNVKKANLLSNLSNILGLPVRELTFSEFLDNAEKYPQNKENAITYAIGAALGKRS